MADESTYEVAGLAAIDARLKFLYPNQEGQVWATTIPFIFGGPDPLDTVFVYESEQGCPHWHYISAGFTDQTEKSDAESEESGYGFELTMRVKRGEEDTAPLWPVNFIQNLAKYVFSSGRVFSANHSMDANGPLCLTSDTKITAMVFQEDCELEPTSSEFGSFAFIQIFGITADELKTVQSWGISNFCQLVRQSNPFLITDLERSSHLDDPVFRSAVDEGYNRDGSSMGAMFMQQLDCKKSLFGKTTLTIGAYGVPDVLRTLTGRLRFNREFSLFGEGGKTVCLSMADVFSIEKIQDGFNIRLTSADLEKIETTLHQKQGEYPITDRFTIKIIPTDLRESDGSLIKTIG